MACGIYKIINNSNNKFYIGSSVNIQQRWSAHKSLLKRGLHANKHLQSSWDKYGEDGFSFVVVEELEEDSILDREQELIEQSRSFVNEVGYNKNLSTTAPMKGRKHSKEAIEKIRKASTGMKHSQETKDKIGKAHKGKVVSKETRERLSKAKKGITPACAHIPMTQEGRRRMSEFASTRTGIKNPNARLALEQIKEMSQDFAENILTIREMSQKYGVSVSTIKRHKYRKTIFEGNK